MGAAEPLGYHNGWPDNYPVDVTRAMPAEQSKPDGMTVPSQKEGLN
jgi:hypothetical protein